MREKLFYGIITLMILMACAPDEDVVARPQKNPTAGITKIKVREVIYEGQHIRPGNVSEKGWKGYDWFEFN